MIHPVVSFYRKRENIVNEIITGEKYELFYGTLHHTSIYSKKITL